MRKLQNELDTKRLFIAFSISDEYKNEIVSSSGYLDKNIWNITPEDNLHITILWLGDVPVSVIPDAEKILENLCSNTYPISLNKAKLMIMTPANPYMLWVRFDKNKWFEDLVLLLEKYFWRIGTWKNNRDRKQRKESGEKISIPHITVARTKGEKLLDSLMTPYDLHKGMDSIKLNTITLYESQFNKDTGNHNYIKIRSFELRK